MVAWVITGTGVTGTHRRDYGSNHKKYYEGIKVLVHYTFMCGVGFIVSNDD